MKLDKGDTMKKHEAMVNIDIHYIDGTTSSLWGSRKWIDNLFELVVERRFDCGTRIERKDCGDILINWKNVAYIEELR
jgi:hypothetical protein